MTMLCYFIFLFSIYPSQSLLLSRGQARNFTSIKWYHFPKSGGTTLRKRVHVMCQKEGFNMTTNYGVKDECNKIPFSCTKGRKVFITYGHKNEEAEFISPGALNIIMVRKPLSWLLSRIQHADRKSKKQKRSKSNSLPLNAEDSSLINAVHMFTPKYLMYTDSQTKTLLMDWYEEIRKDVVSTKPKGSSSYVSTHQSLTASRRLQTLLQKNTLVLVTEQYDRSMRLLSYIFDTNYLLPDNSLDSLKAELEFKKVNQAFDWQQNISVGTYAEMKALSSLLTPHDSFYYAAYQEFLRELEYAKLF